MLVPDRERLITVIVYSVPVLFLVLFLLYPLLSVLEPGFTGADGRPTMENLGKVLGSSRSMGIVRFTIMQAIISTLATLVAALPGAFIIARYRFPGKSSLLALTTVPFVLPPLVLGIGFISLFGTSGLIQGILNAITGITGTGDVQVNLLYSKEAIIVAHIFLNFPIALRILHSRLTTMDPDIINASRSLGAGPVRTFFKVMLPQMRYSILSAASLIFTFCLLTFGVVMVIGGMSNSTLEMEIFRQFNGLFDESTAAVLLSIEVALVSLSTFVYIWSSRRSGVSSHMARGPGMNMIPSYGRGGRRALMVLLYAVLIGVVVLGPMLAVVHDSLTVEREGDEEYSLEWYGRMLSREGDPTIGASPMGAVMNSLLFAFLTVVTAVPMSVLTAYALDRPRSRGKWALDTFLLFPLGVSTVALGIGMLSGFNGGFLDLGGSWIPILIVHTMIAYPLGARAVLAAKREIPDHLIDASRSLGSGRFRAFMDVELPLLLPGIVIAAVFAFAISIGEFGATLMVAPPEYTTMPIALYKFISGGRDFGSATAYAVLIMLVTFSSMFIMDHFGRRFTRRSGSV
ncbi:MAG: iron ABC transporter permease [Candidatus Thermoplasmatota archaeon]|nr:iron ABC transporter permease [Candidatus Thermoplasmatota archaeon]